MSVKPTTWATTSGLGVVAPELALEVDPRNGEFADPVGRIRIDVTTEVDEGAIRALHEPAVDLGRLESDRRGQRGPAFARPNRFPAGPPIWIRLRCSWRARFRAGPGLPPSERANSPCARAGQPPRPAGSLPGSSAGREPFRAVRWRSPRAPSSPAGPATEAEADPSVGRVRRRQFRAASDWGMRTPVSTRG